MVHIGPDNLPGGLFAGGTRSVWQKDVASQSVLPGEPCTDGDAGLPLPGRPGDDRLEGA
jgi:hypothetical protein